MLKSFLIQEKKPLIFLEIIFPLYLKLNTKQNMGEISKC